VVPVPLFSSGFGTGDQTQSLRHAIASGVKYDLGVFSNSEYRLHIPIEADETNKW
jgi:hypothetical protein